MKIEANFDNVYLYVVDSLRYDFVPPKYFDKYDVTQCVAGGTWSPPGFATIITGKYPPEHGIWSFDDKLPTGTDTILNTLDLDSYVYRAFGQVGQALNYGSNINEIRDIRSFLHRCLDEYILLERDLLTHSPYAVHQGSRIPGGEYDYWGRVKDDITQLREDYTQAAKLTFQRFESRLEDINLDNTLVICTADHGELLGEYGLVTHGDIVTPEQVYVPLIIPNKHVSVGEDVMPQTSIAKLVATAVGSTNTVDQLSPDFGDSFISDGYYYAGGKSPAQHSLWNESGGVVSTGTLSEIIKWVVFRLTRAGTANYHRSNITKIMKRTYSHLASEQITYGNPDISSNKIRSVITEANQTTSLSQKRQIDDEAKARLAELGYIERIRNEMD